MPTEDFFTKQRAWASLPMSTLGLSIKGTVLEPILAEFGRELERIGIRRVKPVFYLSTEWGVPSDTVAIAIPFYLAHPELVRLHSEKVGHIEGLNPADILRYLRHEMGHVVNYAYRLYQRPAWEKIFGSIEQSYDEEYRPEPFSRRFVRHLPGWYAQKHPDEDWAETFAVWMTPGADWRAEYAEWPEALAKLAYCDKTLAEIRECEPLVTAADLDEDVGQLSHSLDEFYGNVSAPTAEFTSGLDGALRAALEHLRSTEEGEPQEATANLVRALEHDLMADIYRWTGHFPERTRHLLRYLAERAEAQKLSFPQARERQAIVGLTTLVTALAMNHVRLGWYLA
jgi:hypothetical protein